MKTKTKMAQFLRDPQAQTLTLNLTFKCNGRVQTSHLLHSLMIRDGSSDLGEKLSVMPD